MGNIVLTSVGIDIGTTTTQIAVARLTLANVMPGNRVPCTEITARDVLYISDARLTPFIDRKTIDRRALERLIAEEYAKAGIDKLKIDTGAVIITGETARKENAAEIAAVIAGLAGDFVVATAGPDLESVIAAKGSGAAAYSENKQCLVANVDIGGGTSNVALFDRGKCIGTACINVGGRLVEADAYTGEITWLSGAAESVAEYLERSGKKFADQITLAKAVLHAMAEYLSDYLCGHDVDEELSTALLMSGKLPAVKPEYLMFSGGVAKYMPCAGGTKQPLWHIHGDTGPLLAECIERTELCRCRKVLPADNTLHATVLGAGAHTVSVSGSTVTVHESSLPLRNIPVLKPQGEYDYSEGIERYSVFGSKAIALLVPDLQNPGFAELQELAAKLSVTVAQLPEVFKVLVTRQDIAKALGLALKVLMPEEVIICLDEIDARDGDYLDIGKPLPGQDAVPVVVKTLVFYQ